MRDAIIKVTASAACCVRFTDRNRSTGFGFQKGTMTGRATFFSQIGSRAGRDILRMQLVLCQFLAVMKSGKAVFMQKPYRQYFFPVYYTLACRKRRRARATFQYSMQFAFCIYNTIFLVIGGRASFHPSPRPKAKSISYRPDWGPAI